MKANLPGQFERAKTTTKSLPEYCHYPDTGCKFADSCLNCPFAHCLYDGDTRDSWKARRPFIEQRNNEIRERLQNGESVDEMVKRFNLSARTIYRAINGR